MLVGRRSLFVYVARQASRFIWRPVRVPDSYPLRKGVGVLPARSNVRSNDMFQRVNVPCVTHDVVKVCFAVNVRIRVGTVAQRRYGAVVDCQASGLLLVARVYHFVVRPPGLVRQAKACSASDLVRPELVLVCLVLVSGFVP